MILEFRPFGKLKEEVLTMSEGGTLITLGCSHTTRQDQLGLLKSWIRWTSSVKIFLTGCLKTSPQLLQLLELLRMPQGCFAPESPEMFCGIRNFTSMIHLHGGDQVTTEF